MIKRAWVQIPLMDIHAQRPPLDDQRGLLLFLFSLHCVLEMVPSSFATLLVFVAVQPALAKNLLYVINCQGPAGANFYDLLNLGCAPLDCNHF